MNAVLIRSNCINCGAPLDDYAKPCAYCGTAYRSVMLIPAVSCAKSPDTVIIHAGRSVRSLAATAEEATVMLSEPHYELDTTLPQRISALADRLRSYALDNTLSHEIEALEGCLYSWKNMMIK